MYFPRFLLLLGTLAVLASCDAGGRRDKSAATGGDSPHAPSSPAGGSNSARVALVIGNNKYANLPATSQLMSPVADARDVAAALQGLGYTLVTGRALTDAGRDEMLTATESFAQRARNAEAAVFYFSGHGVQVGEDNYLLATDTPRLTGLSVLKSRTVLLRDVVMIALEEAGARNKVIILDCCRDNPFAAQLETALAEVGKGIKTKGVGEMSGYGPGFYLAFATSPGFTADDGNGQRNSPFTAALLKSLPGGAAKDIDFFFRDVKVLLGDEQVSWTNHSLKSPFALAPGIPARLENAPGSAPVPALPSSPVPPAAPATAATPAPPLQMLAALAHAPAPAPRAALKQETATAPPPPEAGDTLQITLPGGVKMTFCYCPPGTFLMGSPSSEKFRDSRMEPLSRVSHTRGYWMAKTECTQAQWMAVTGANPSYFKGSTDLPVESVTWEDIQEYLLLLRQVVTPPAGFHVALPTEAEWEYACRSGSARPFAFGDTLTSAKANYNGSLSPGYPTTEQRPFKTVPAASYPANAWGLHDMHGNVNEMCRDNSFNVLLEGADPVGETTGPYRMIRGGSWVVAASDCRSACRELEKISDERESVGFRLALVPTDGR